MHDEGLYVIILWGTPIVTICLLIQWWQKRCLSRPAQIVLAASAACVAFVWGFIPLLSGLPWFASLQIPPIVAAIVLVPLIALGLKKGIKPIEVDQVPTRMNRRARGVPSDVRRAERYHRRIG